MVREIKEQWDIPSDSRANLTHKLTLYEDDSFACSCEAWIYNRWTCRHIKKKASELSLTPKTLPLEFEINEFILLRLERGQTNIYVNDQLFNQCKFLLLRNPHLNPAQKTINSIDEAEEKLSNSLEKEKTISDIGLTATQEFIGHASNLQVWAEYNYDTRLLHRNLAFPLLRRLTEVGDSKAKLVFLEEVKKRVKSGHSTVINYLLQQNYFEEFSKDDQRELWDIIRATYKECYKCCVDISNNIFDPKFENGYQCDECKEWFCNKDECRPSNFQATNRFLCRECANKKIEINRERFRCKNCKKVMRNKAMICPYCYNPPNQLSLSDFT